jgi:uncharacterized protein
VSTIIWSFSFSKKEIKTYKNAVSVVGVSTKDVVSDKAVWRIAVSRKSLDRADNIKKLGTDEKTIRDFVIGLGFSKDEISSSQLTVNPVYKPKDNGYGDTNEITAYESKITVFVTSQDVYKISGAVDQLRRFCEEKNIDLADDNAEYTYSKFESEKIPLLKLAIKDAQERANALVNASSGVSKTSIGKILSAQQGVFQVNSKNDNSVSDYGNFDLSSVEKTIRATVKVDFNTE